MMTSERDTPQASAHAARISVVRSVFSSAKSTEIRMRVFSPSPKAIADRVRSSCTSVVLHDAVVEVHVSGHACQEELKLLQALVRPKYFMPIHGEYRHLAANRELAMDMGMSESDIFISDIGKVLEIDSKGARFAGTVPAGKILVDGYGVGDVGNIVLRDRKHLSQDGLIVVVASVDLQAGLLLSGPDIVSRGFVYVREAEELMEEAKQIAGDAINRCLGKGRRVDRMELKTAVKDDLTKFLYAKTKRKPMVLPVIMNM